MAIRKLIPFVLIFSFLFIFASCNKDDDTDMSPMEMEEMEEMEPPAGDTFSVESIQGLSQKGPYLIGSSVTIFELEGDLSPTGRSFTEDITTNLGSFEISNLTLASPFVELRASGFYFNEVTGENSEAQLNLSAIVDLTDQGSINVNILTTLEKNRVEYLIDQGASFSEAKSQALTEVLNVFELTTSVNATAEQLNITEIGNGNAILLAVSAILQGNNSVGEVSELISKISLGLETGGQFDDDMVCSQLSSAASLINPTSIRENLEQWYASANTQISIPAFEPFITQYIQNTPCLAESGITYPPSGNSGLNLLSDDNTLFDVGESYTMRAVLEEGTSLAVRVVGNNWTMNIGQGDTGWLVGDWDGERADINRGRNFSAARTGSVDFKINLTNPLSDGLHSDEIKFELFENGSSVPTRTIVKKIQGITPRPSGSYSLLLATPSTTGPTENLLGNLFFFGFPNISRLDEDNKYGFGVFLPNNFDVEILVSGENFDFPSSGFNQGWVIEKLNDNENLWRLTASGEGFYETELAMDFTQGCVVINTEVLVNGESFSTFSLDSNQQDVFFSPNPDGQHGPNVLFRGNTHTVGSVSLAAELDFPDPNFGLNDLTVILHGEGWSIPSPIENKNWIIEDFDATSQSQTFRGTFDEYNFDGENDLKLMIDNFNSSNPPNISVEISTEVQGCGAIILEAFDLRF